MEYRNLCQNCGSDLRKVTDTHYACVHCNTVYSTEKIESYAEKMNKLFDASKLELISNARKNLYKAVSDKYISSKAVHDACVEIKKYLPDDFQANFYDSFLNSSPVDIAKMIRKINIKENVEALELMLTFLLKSLEQEFVLDVAALIERTYKSGSTKNLVKYDEYATKLSEEAQKLDDWMYVTDVPRDVFIAYSSEDIDKVLELVDELENNQGLQCFISIRNLRHGAGSRENYTKALQEAMDNCKSFVFVSSKNSRRQGCDAFRVEIPYIKKKDMERAAHLGYLNYEAIPPEIKTPRVEYRLNDSEHKNAADIIVDEFFSGWERVYTPIEVAERVMRQTTPIQASTAIPHASAAKSQSQPKDEPKPTPKRVKFCVSCFSKCYEDMEQCDVCGETTFASSLNEAKRLNKEEKERKKKKEKVQKKQKKEKVKRNKERQPKNVRPLIWIVASLLIIGLIVLAILFEGLRAWAIASIVSAAYVAIWNLIRRRTEIYYVPWCIFTNVCVAIAIIPLVCISSTRPYAFCFALALLINSSGLIARCWKDVSVETKREKIKYGWQVQYEDVKSYSFKFGPWEYLLNLYSIFVGIILFSISLGVLFSGVPRLIIIGCGVGIAYIALAIITKVCLYTQDLEGTFIFLFIAVGIISLIFAFISYYFVIITICAMIGVIISALMLSIFYRNSTWYTCLVGGFIIAGIAVLTLLFMHNKPSMDFQVEDGVLVSYAGNDEVIVIPDDVERIGAKAFCFSGPKKNMKEVILHNGIKSIGESAFKNCDALERVVIPGSVETINMEAFYECDSLKEVVFEEGLETILTSAFTGCKNIKKIQLPESLKELGPYAFSGCVKLSEIYIRSGIETIGTGVLANGTDIKIYYEGSESEWNKIDKGSGLIKWTYCIRDYEVIFDTYPKQDNNSEGTEESESVDITDNIDNNANTEVTQTVEPAMYYILPQKSKVIIPMA